jgi:hypothetical protein
MKSERKFANFIDLSLGGECLIWIVKLTVGRDWEECVLAVECEKT